MTAVVGWVLAVAGAVWVLQGMSVSWAPESFMTGDPRWVAAGAVGVAVGVALIWRGRRKSE